jgi:hypothetical protein
MPRVARLLADELSAREALPQTVKAGPAHRRENRLAGRGRQDADAVGGDHLPGVAGDCSGGRSCLPRRAPFRSRDQEFSCAAASVTRPA